MSNIKEGDRNTDSQTGTLVFKIHSAKDLVPKDTNGFSDPYVKVGDAVRERVWNVFFVVWWMCLLIDVSNWN